jgi:hypothetical protein
MSVKHPNSRIVTIFRKDSFINNAQQGSAPEFVSQAKRSLGSYWENSFSKTMGSGLNFEEQALLLPSIVDCEPTDRNFRAKVSEYYAQIKTNIPAEKGRPLEIGLLKDNTQPVSVENQPLNLADYITYRHALNHPLVAKSKDPKDDSMLKEYYIFDPAAAEASMVRANEDKDVALELYLKIKKTPEKIDMLLTLLDVDPRTFKGVNAAKLKADELKKLAEKDPSTFVATFNDKHFETLYDLQSMVNTGVLKRIGDKFIYPETGETIGHSVDEAIAYVKDPKNSETLVLLKARTQEALAKPLPAGVKATQGRK